MSDNTEYTRVCVTVRPSQRVELEKLAARNERSLSAELRVALNEHFTRVGQAVAA
jgi:hypothetical protein